jgi:hypothetical protein
MASGWQLARSRPMPPRLRTCGETCSLSRLTLSLPPRNLCNICRSRSAKKLAKRARIDSNAVVRFEKWKAQIERNDGACYPAGL